MPLFSTLLFRLRRTCGGKLAPDRKKKLKEFLKSIGIRFRDPELLNQALSHRSYIYTLRYKDLKIESNERMEFLGDSVLSLVVNKYLYFTFPEWQEGKLTQIKSLVVSKSFLAKKAEEIDLGRYLLLSENESIAGGRERESIICDAFEALIGAIYLDRGIKVAGKFIQDLICSDIEELYRSEQHLNSKSILQEHVQRELKCQPRYRIRKVQGPDHRRYYTIDVYIKGKRICSGKGYSKKAAQLHAADEALKILNVT